jgi:hypothetical protein
LNILTYGLTLKASNNKTILESQTEIKNNIEIDFFNMIMPATVGDQWFIGISEISSVLFFAGLFIFVVFTALTKAPLASEGNPYIEESKHFHY